MAKIFSVNFNLSHKYSGENNPIVIRQNDVGTQISAQILVDDDTPYDLTDCNITFNLKLQGHTAVLNEEVQITNAKQGLVNYLFTSKVTKFSGYAKHAYFQISDSKTKVVESTGDIDLKILPSFPILPDKDDNFKTETFKIINGSDGFDNNINLITNWDTYNYLFPVLNSTTPQPLVTNSDIYKTFRDNQQSENFFQFISNNTSPIVVFAYALKVHPKASKIRISNMGNIIGNVLFTGKCNSFGLTDKYGIVYYDWMRRYAKKIVPINALYFNGQDSLDYPEVTTLSIDENGNADSIEVDLTKNRRLLTTDNYFMLYSNDVENTKDYIKYQNLDPRLGDLEYENPHDKNPHILYHYFCIYNPQLEITSYYKD
ncbi:phage baseplate upper protein [Bombilactobacillus folatiphilus]|uniref:Phage baseplate upper protein n=1 Tax=Bombilactobacillus folatiphilus TaxID=2923362 RepID=A0ABY4PAG5_9LACO|nr:BppU family phage baseplate upper protein [Bombilactobacillus folatiphilus]UQS82615.1 phage baseplate upper protein [Bombilactobacillus folatiphilus]